MNTATIMEETRATEERRRDESAPAAPHRSSPPPATEIAVRVRDLVKRYADGTLANRGIDLEVRGGEIVSILGPNGAGKTTFLRQLTTELLPTDGTVEVFSVDAVAAPDDAKQLMGITPQEAGLFERLTVREHFEFFARLKNLSRREARTAARVVISQLGLVGETDRRVGALSGGQRRRVLIGLALLGKPPLLVLDEPTTGLDPASRRAVWDVIRRAVSEGATAVLSTHYMEEAEQLSDRVGIIVAGALVACGTLDELLALIKRSYRLSYRDPRVAHGAARSLYFATFAGAQQHVAREGLTEYSVARASLEDVYFTLTGEPFAEFEIGGAT
jgi:ABC-type multidrug transport system ATPase subunit